MKSLPDVFYPIAGTADEVALAVGAGARFIQLRNKSEDEVLLREEIRSALKVCRFHGAILVVNDHWELALAEKAPYIHLGQEDMQGADIDRIHKAGVKLGISTHDHTELDRARAVNPAYIALGPVWKTKLKVMPWAPQGLGRVGEWARLIAPVPLVAIGGVTVERARACIEAGAAAVSVVSDVFRNGDIAERVHLWRKALDNGGVS
ncbi:thiamine phosphate synthase [Acetobacteraceae bacterium ESL0709]|nr:thiamine phosphate synthase [Acetobacteraceae bacterium ESL0697]MDF7678176.1 thiamine phosphate synthase [Acetobacteraceae bacterium ESL0709]